MSKSSVLGFHLFLLSSLSYAEVTIGQPVGFREAFKSVGKMVHSPPNFSGLNQGLFPLPFLSKIVSFIQDGVAKTKEVNEEAKRREQEFKTALKRDKTFEELVEERKERIKELRQKIEETRYLWKRDQEGESVEEMQEELNELLESPIVFERDETDSVVIGTSDSIFPGIEKKTTLFVPGMLSLPNGNQNQAGAPNQKPRPGVKLDCVLEYQRTREEAEEEEELLRPPPALRSAVTVQPKTRIFFEKLLEPCKLSPTKARFYELTSFQNAMKRARDELAESDQTVMSSLLAQYSGGQMGDGSMDTTIQLEEAALTLVLNCLKAKGFGVSIRGSHFKGVQVSRVRDFDVLIFDEEVLGQPNITAVRERAATVLLDWVGDKNMEDNPIRFPENQKILKAKNKEKIMDLRLKSKSTKVFLDLVPAWKDGEEIKVFRNKGWITDLAQPIIGEVDRILSEL
ncbi:MAG: hypothetical protein I8H75_03055 [Myxococcaceae bacterium]|nr:hypothetical protein [Myxococcaceae bacterium]MBH2006308.1 hypothetical protein [Myxococcaceae bacterium]